MKYVSALHLLFISLFFTSCDFIDSLHCSSEDEYSVNTVLVREYISDPDFQNFSLLRSYQYGDEETLNAIGGFHYTLDGKFTIASRGYINYGADISIFDEEFTIYTLGEDYSKLNDYRSNSGDYNNVKDEFISTSRGLLGIELPETQDSIELNVDLVVKFSNTFNPVDTLFFTNYEFIDSNAYKYNSIQHIEYGRDGDPLLLINDWIEEITFNQETGSYNRNKEIKGSHIVKVLPDLSHDTLFTYIDDSKVSSYNQIYFSSTNAGIFVKKLDYDVHLLNDDGTLTTVYSDNELGNLPNRSNLKGTAVFGDKGDQYYDFEREKHIDLKTQFYGTDKVVYGYPSNYGLIALMLSGTSSLNTNQEKLFIYDTYSESLIDSVTIDELSPFSPLEAEETYTKLTNPVFTSDNRLIFMHVYTAQYSRCYD